MSARHVYLVVKQHSLHFFRLLTAIVKLIKIKSVIFRPFVLDYFNGIRGRYVWDHTITLKPKSKIATKLFPFTDTLMLPLKQKKCFWQKNLTGSSFSYTRTLTYYCDAVFLD